MSVICAALIGWAAVVWYAGETDTREQWLPPTWLPAGIIVITTVGLMVVHLVLLGRYRLTVDETMYVLQARWMGEPGLGRKVPTDLVSHFALAFTFLRGDLQIVKYPPGWPALLALADSAHVRLLLSPVLSAITLACLFRLGTRLHSRAAGLIAVVLVASQQWFLELHSSLLSHPASTAALTGAALILVDHDESRRHPSARRAALAGLLIGIAVTVRPITGVLVGLSLALWIWLRSAATWREKARLGVFGVIGALPAIVAFLAYNRATTGDPFVLGYTTTHGSFHSLGFGLRGTGTPFLFTPRRAMELFAALVSDYLQHAVALGLLVPFAWFGVAHGARPRWSVVAGFLLLPAVQFFYFSNRARVHSELFPFLLLGVAVLLAAAGRKVWPLVAFAVAANFIFAPLWAESDLSRPYPQFTQTLETLGSRARHGERLLVFFDRNGAWVGRTTAVNLLTLDGIVLVHHHGQLDSLVIKRFPSYTPLWLTYQGDGKAPLLTSTAGE
jgi:4-amino-4-deoxy-L-arabinose transferase-like glycosyltransferase